MLNNTQHITHTKNEKKILQIFQSWQQNVIPIWIPLLFIEKKENSKGHRIYIFIFLKFSVENKLKKNIQTVVQYISVIIFNFVRTIYNLGPIITKSISL